MSTPQTYGWDLVLAARTSALDHALSGTGGTFDETIQHSGGPVDVSGGLGDWTFTPGGSDALVRFAVPCQEVTLTQGKRSYSFRYGSLLIEASLDLGGTGARKSLRISAGTARALDATFDDTDFPKFRAMTVSGVQAWLDKQTQSPSEIAALSLSAVMDGGPAAALLPTAANYAYADTADGSDGVLGILCTVAASGRSADTLLQEVDPGAIGTGDGAMLVGEAALACIVDLSLSHVAFAGAAAPAAPVVAPLCLPMHLKGGK